MHNIAFFAHPRLLPSIMDFLKNMDINALRIPVSLDMVLTTNQMIRNLSCDAANEELCPNGSEGALRPYALDVLETVIKEASYRGMLVVLDMHALTVKSGMGTINPEVWYDEKYNEQQLIDGWNYLLSRFKSYTNIMGIELMNGLHGFAGWGLGETAMGEWDTLRDLPVQHDWFAAIHRIIAGIADENADYDGLFFIQGVEGKPGVGLIDGSIYDDFGLREKDWEYWWGSNFEGVYKHRVDLGQIQQSWAKRIVYSTQVYAPSLDSKEDPMTYFPPAVANFPGNMEEVWDAQIKKLKLWGLGAAVVVGAWGGSGDAWDEDWHHMFVKWMVTNCVTNNFYWELSSTANTGGIMAASGTSFDALKLEAMNSVQIKPTSFEILRYSDQCTCVRYGEHSNSACCKEDCPTTLCDPNNPFDYNCYDNPQTESPAEYPRLNSGAGRASKSLTATATALLALAGMAMRL